MISGLVRAGAAASMILGAWIAWGQPTSASSVEASYAAVGEETSVPYGWVDFCKRYESECDDERIAAVDINLSAKALREITRVNHWVNAHVEPISDMDHWGLVDRWDYPLDGKGDCEDYALLKRKMLIDLGFPRQALLMTVVKDESQEGHAILTLKTSKGEFVLDNLNDDVKPWTTTPYRFVKRQSQQDQNVWVMLGPPVEAPLYTAR
ncbi:transglutaminase-like cysteine peptidase [Methylocapsa sp. S129]|uniref:transglutaminase-like cysteine peptidase n=1 Tax=Methylocapsa sp. S129 TaxID=1641869 RepID=UPI00131B8EB7